MTTYKTIAETNNFIVLDNYKKISETNEPPAGFQPEAELESEFIQDLKNQGYEYDPNINSPETMLANVRVQLEALNKMKFSNDEWKRFVEEYLDQPNDSITDKTRKIHDNYIYDFTFDDKHIQNIYLLDKEQISRNKLQVISQFAQKGTHANRYDVTILVNGLPLVQIELKKRGVNIREAFNQVSRYTKESFNTENSLYKYLQIFVISNGTNTLYYANTTERSKSNFSFTMNWARANNDHINDLKDFTATFFQKRTLLNILIKYTVFDTQNTLLIMRPYQIAATERILWKIKSSFESNNLSKPESGGYIWHTTGSGKTLTSFKVARLATSLPFIDKVFFVVDRKDLDEQTMKEYQKFSPDSVNGSSNTAELKRNLEKDDNKIVVTTIQKLNNLMRGDEKLPIYNKQVVFIFDEAHRSQFGEAQKNLKKKFKKYCQFGFTGTPIFPENALGTETTADVFGKELHSYVITNAITDDKVLRFKVDYNDVRPTFKDIETETDEEKLSAAENKKALLHPKRINEISQYILKNFRRKTHRTLGNGNGFNAMFAVSSVDAAKCYYTELNKLQKDADKPLKIATIFSFAANEEQSAKGEIIDESFETSAMDTSAKEFLTKAINDYNTMFKCNYGVDSNGFQLYYKDLSERVKNQEIDLLIVVGMFLTGFDAKCLNTLFVDKNLRYHGLIQAYSRTNRIYNDIKAFGNIITFRDLEQATIDAIKLFGDSNTRNVVLEKSYKEYLEGFNDVISGHAKRGYIEVVKELNTKFPSPDEIISESDKKEFTRLFGEYLKIENILQNYDEFTSLKALQNVDINNKEDLEKFKEIYSVSDEDIEAMEKIDLLNERKVQDYRSTYNDIREWLHRQKSSKEAEESNVDWDDVVFEVELLKSQEINVDFILFLIHDKHQSLNKDELITEVKRMIRSSIDNRAKESLIVAFIQDTNIDSIKEKADILDSFYKYAQQKQKEEAQELIETENLEEEGAKRFITISLKHEKVPDTGTDLSSILPKMNPFDPKSLSIKRKVHEKITSFVEKFKGVGGKI